MKKIFLILCLMLSLPVIAQESPKIVAHRGYWQTYGSAQNSIRSFERADEIGCYGSEFDVWMTSDSILVVHHDAKTSTGLTIENVPYTMLKDLKLTNGENIPTLRELLECSKRTNIVLVFELKPHATPEKNQEAARRSVALLKEKNLLHRTDFITFSRPAGEALIKLAPERPVYHLSGDLSPKELKQLGYAGLDYHYDAMRKHPEWFKEAHALGLGVNVWTVDDPEIIREMANYGADFITTNIPNDALNIFGK